MDIKEYKRSFVLKRLLKRNLSSFNGISIYEIEYKDLLKHEVKIRMEELKCIN